MDDPVRRIHEVIDKKLPRRHSNRVMHAHPSPTLWLERDVPLQEIVRGRAWSETGRCRKLSVYVGTPYCLPTTPDRCGFCLFPSEVYRSPDQLVTYLRHLAIEGELYRPWLEDAEAAAIYFGGGTTNLYRPQQYSELMAIVRRVLPRTVPDLEVTIEGVAQLFTKSKLEAMREAGVTRVSMGVQQFDPELLRRSGRKQDKAHVLRMLELCRILGLGSNVDLIFGWPGQTVVNVLRDLETVVRLEIPHLTHYELNVGGMSDFARRRRDELPTVQENLEMYRTAKQYLEASGYLQVTPYDWERTDAGLAGVLRYEVCSRTPFESQADGALTGYDCWGWGFAALSRWFRGGSEPGWVLANSPHVDPYYRHLDEGRIPVERGFRYTKADLRLYTLFQMLQGLCVDRSLYGRLFGLDPLDEHPSIWQALVEREWAVVEADQLRVIGDGGFHVPLMQELLAAGRLEEMRRERRGQRVGVDAAPEEAVLEARS
jgi:oxygen-independent coproporphyrinogen-3 oxidase